MKFVDYIFGSRRGHDANELEKQSMTDPFLSDAMDGFDGVYDNHHDILNDLSQKITARAAKKSRRASFTRQGLYLAAGIAAAVLVVVSVVFIVLPPSGVVENDGIAANLASDSAESSEGVVSAGIAATSVDENISDNAFAASETDVAESQELKTGSEDRISVLGDDEITGVLYNSTKVADASADAKSNAAEAAVKPEAVSAGSRSMALTATESATAEESVAAQPLAMNENAGGVAADNIREVRNERFEKYFAANNRALRSAGGGQSGSFVVEFRVNDAGIPTSVRVVSGVSQEVNRKVIELLVSGPVWEPTSGERVRTVLKY